MAVGNGDTADEVFILPGDGDGDFGLRFNVGLRPDYSATGNLNGDGAIDVVTNNTDSKDVSILLGNGDGTLQPESRISFPNVNRALTLADVDEDEGR